MTAAKLRQVTLLLAALLALLSAAAQVAHAHTRSQSLTSLSVEGDEVVVIFRVTAREVTRLGVLDPQAESLNELLASHLVTALDVTRGNQTCPLSGAPAPSRASAAELAFELRYLCASNTDGAAIAFTNNAFFPIASRHIHFSRARSADGGFEERLLTATQRTASFAFSQDGRAAPLTESWVTTAGRYIALGAEHIWIGIDHLAFLVGLLLLCRRLRDVVFVVTGFTIGHSVTLSLTVLGLAVPNPPVVEALIAFTIVLVAIESLVLPQGLSARGVWAACVTLLALAAIAGVLGSAIPLPVWTGLILLTGGYAWVTRDAAVAARLLPAVTTIFGLVHGFGFAGVLLDLGLPQERLALALFSFNLGVEIGQVVFVAALWAAARLAGPMMNLPVRDTVRVASAALLSVAGSYWFALRAFG